MHSGMRARAPEKLHVSACLAAADHAKWGDHEHFTEIVANRVAGAGILHPVEESSEALHFPASCLHPGHCFPTGNHAGTQKPREIHSNAIALSGKTPGIDCSWSFRLSSPRILREFPVIATYSQGNVFRMNNMPATALVLLLILEAASRLGASPPLSASG